MKCNLIASMAFAAAVTAQVPDSRLPVEQRAWVATKVYSSIQMFNAHAEGAPGFDLDREYQDYLKTAMTSDDRRTFDLATIQFVGKLRNGHSGFYDSWLFDQYGQPLGFTLLPIAKGWVVTVSRLAAIDPGDIVVSVGGKPIEQVYAEMDGFLEGSSETTRRRTFSWRTYLWPETFELVLGNGKRVAIDRIKQKPEPARTFPFPQGRVKTPEGIGYIRIQSFEDSAMEKSAVRQVKELKEARALLIDVRGNGGGSTPTELISMLLDRAWRDFGLTTPVHIAHAGAQTQVSRVFPKTRSDP